MSTNCAFCAIAAGQAPATLVREWDDAVAIRPRSGGVTDGHVLVLPRTHVTDAGTDPEVTAAVMRRAAELVAEHPHANVITSKGSDATQTVFHLHIHVVPRQADDGLQLPWSPPEQARPPVNLVMAREPIPSGPSVFLAGPTPRRDEGVPSWRPAAVDALTEQWAGPGPLTVFSPESRGGQRAERYEDQADWETAARAAADAILFWIPRDVRSLPGFTTNVEFGIDVGTGRAVLGCPPDCASPERNRYLIYVAKRHGTPVRETLTATCAAALQIVTT